MALSVDHLAEQSRKAVYQASQAGRLSRNLFDESTRLERMVGQFLILEEPGLLKDYQRQRQEFLTSAAALQKLFSDADYRHNIDNLIVQESSLYALIPKTNRVSLDKAKFIQGYSSLVEEAQKILRMSNKLADDEVLQLQTLALQSWKNLVWRALIIVPIALVLAILLSFFIVRPIRQLARAIRRLGQTDFSKPINIRGPKDLHFIGQQLDWLRNRLSTLESEKTKFLRHVSHELKTPLAAIREGVELLRDGVGGPLSTQQNEIVGILRNNALELQKLIENLLAFQQAGRHPAASEVVNLKTLIQEVAKEHEITLFARGLTIEAKLVELSLQGDRHQLRVIIDNLLSNAIKYSPRWGKIGVYLKKNDAGYIQIDVLDQGPGILATEQQLIFDTFYQGEIKPGGPIKGTGLGLAIVRDYVEKHGGVVEVCSTNSDNAEYVGAHLRIVFPIPQSAALTTQLDHL